MSTKPKAAFDDFGRILKARRVYLRISQRDYADRIGISYPHLCNIENGHADPTIGMAKKIAKGLGMCLVLKEIDK